jgi:hypothetical protein
MPDSVAAALSNPTTRLLTTTSPLQMAQRGSLAAALEALSAFSVVGLRERPNSFLEDVALLMDREEVVLPSLSRPHRVAEVAAMLEQVEEIKYMLEKDLELFFEVTAACSTSAM